MKEYITALKALFVDTWEVFKNFPEIVENWLTDFSEHLNDFLNTDLGDGDYGD